MKEASEDEAEEETTDDAPFAQNESVVIRGSQLAINAECDEGMSEQGIAITRSNEQFPIENEQTEEERQS